MIANRKELQQIEGPDLARWRNAIIGAFALGGVTVAAFGTRLPAIKDSLQTSSGMIGTILAGTTIGSLGGLALAPWVSQRIGARVGIRGALLIVAIGLALISAAVGWLTSVALSALGLAAMGFGIGLLDVLMNVDGALVEKAANKTLMPLFHGSWSAGAIVGGIIGSLCAAAQVPVLWQFLGEAAVIVIVTLLLTQAIPIHDTQDDGPSESPSPGARVRRLGSYLTDWRLLLIGVVMLGSELGEGSANNWLTLAAREEHHRSPATAAAFFVLFAVGETIARIGGGPLIDAWGRVAAVRVSSALGVVGVILFISTTAWWLVAIGTVLWSIGVSMGFPLGMSAAADSGPNPAARVSVVATIGYAANLAGPPALGHLADAVGLLRALWVIAALMVVAALCAPVLGKGRATPH